MLLKYFYDKLHLKGEIGLDEWLSLNDAAEMLNVHRTTIYRWAKAGKITIYKKMGQSIVKKTDVEKILREIKPLYPGS